MIASSELSDSDTEIFRMGTGRGESRVLLDGRHRLSHESCESTSTQEAGTEPGKSSGSRYPKSVFFIVGNEFCERFSYYGMRAILVIYLTDWLSFGHNLATAIYHSFVVLCYVMPLFGAMIADGLLGKYRTILYLSLVYVLGNLIMTFTAFPPPFWLGPMLGLTLIGVGTGGIKPCVSAFGGDQFTADQVKELSQFFSLFYFAINMGSLLSTIITPILREYVNCFDHSCYSLAFGIPAGLMILSLVCFVAGRNLYKIIPSEGNVIAQLFKCTGRALKNRLTGTNGEKEHWLDYADDKYDQDFINDLKLVYRVFLLFLPLPIFWALFDQQALNPVLIITLIPLSETLLYPGLQRCGIDFRLLQRMVVGMLLAAVAFFLAGFIQLKIQGSELFDVDSSTYSVQFDMPRCSALSGNSTATLLMKLKSKESYHAVVSNQAGQLQAELLEYNADKPKEGGGMVSIIYASDVLPFNGTITMKQAEHHDTYRFHVDSFTSTEYQELKPNVYAVYASYDDSNIPLPQTLQVKNGGFYTLLIQPNTSDMSQLQMTEFVDKEASSVSVLWQIPQYFVITSGEILFSVSGLNLGYSQAPKSMKSLVGAGWLMTVAGGNIIDIIIAGSGVISNQAVEFFVFAALMLVMTFIFAIQSYFYEYVTVDVTNGYRDLDRDRQALETDTDFELTSTESDTASRPAAEHPAYTAKPS